MSVKATTAKKTSSNKPVSALITLDQITFSDDFSFRSQNIDTNHVADLATTIKNMGKALDPVLLWRPPEGAGEPNELILLDGTHRIAAYQAVSWQETIPALILDGIDRRNALGAALKANSKRSLSLSQMERLDAAWRLVREPVEPRYKVGEVVYLSDVSVRTVKYMRSRFRVLTENNGEITGSWLRDRNDNPFDNETAQMSDARRRAEIRKLAADFRDLIDRRKHPEREILRESEAIWEAIQEAVGDRNLKDMFSYLWGSEEDSDEWLAFRESHQDNAFNDIEQEDDEEPNF